MPEDGEKNMKLSPINLKRICQSDKTYLLESTVEFKRSMIFKNEKNSKILLGRHTEIY